MKNIDKINLLFQKYDTDILNKFFCGVSFLATDKIFIIILSFLCIYDRNLAIKMVLSYIISSVFVFSLKTLLKIKRPFQRNKKIKPSKLAVKSAEGFSFPSAHSQAIASVLFPVFFITQNYLFLIIILLVGFSRIYLGVHSIYDVLFSLILCYFISYFVINYSNTYLIFLSLVLNIFLILIVYINSFPKDSFIVCLSNFFAIFNILIGLKLNIQNALFSYQNLLMSSLLTTFFIILILFFIKKKSFQSFISLTIFMTINPILFNYIF